MHKKIEEHIAETATNFKRGTAEMLLLFLLKERDWYAYELSKALKARSLEHFDIQGPSLYTILYRLQDKGFVTTRDEQVGKRIRVYYHISPAGEMYLDRIMAEYRSVTDGISAVLLGAYTNHIQEGDA